LEEFDEESGALVVRVGVVKENGCFLLYNLLFGKILVEGDDVGCL
jgi:hypothetical protein